MRGIRGVGIKTGLGIVRKIKSTDIDEICEIIKSKLNDTFSDAVDLALEDLVKFNSGIFQFSFNLI